MYNVSLFIGPRVLIVPHYLSDYNCEVAFVTVNVIIPTINTTSLLMSINNWIVIQQRIDGKLSFNKNWTVYKRGFGNIDKNFWLGLEEMHQLTTNAPYRLRIELQAVKNDKWLSAEYDSFFITSELLGYALNVLGYVGDAGDALNGISPQNGMTFSTGTGGTYASIYDEYDYMHVSICAKGYTSGFWFNQCFDACLNCVYGTKDFTWNVVSNHGSVVSTNLKACRMMIKAV